MKCPKEGCNFDDAEDFKSVIRNHNAERLAIWKLHFLINPTHKPRDTRFVKI